MPNITDKITDVRNTTRPVSTTASSTRSSGGDTLACASLTGWPTASKVHFVTYKIDSNSNPIVGTQLDCSGIVSGSSIGSLTVIDGTDNGNSVGDIVEMLPTAAWGQDLADALTEEHDREGKHTDITADTLVVSSGTTLPAGDIGTADLANGAVTSMKLVESFFRGRLQANTTNTAPTGLTVQHGWGFITGTSGTEATKTVTFPTAFSAVPFFLVSGVGYKASDPTDETDCATNSGMIVMGRPVNTSTASVHVIDYQAGNLGTTRYLFSWIAIGAV
jgi:hypothetical protein